MTEEEIKIRFKNLSIPLKILVVFGWIIGVIFSLAFLVGFIEGMILLI